MMRYENISGLGISLEIKFCNAFLISFKMKMQVSIS